MFVVAWQKTDAEFRTEDRYQRIEDFDEAQTLYERVRSEQDTYTASLTIEIKSTDPT